MSEKVNIKGIKLAIGKQEIELTLEQAKELKTALEELLPKAREPRPDPVPYPIPYPRYQYWKVGDRTQPVTMLQLKAG